MSIGNAVVLALVIAAAAIVVGALAALGTARILHLQNTSIHEKEYEFPKYRNSDGWLVIEYDLTPRQTTTPVRWHVSSNVPGVIRTMGPDFFWCNLCPFRAVLQSRRKRTGVSITRKKEGVSHEQGEQEKSAAEEMARTQEAQEGGVRLSL